MLYQATCVENKRGERGKFGLIGYCSPWGYWIEEDAGQSEDSYGTTMYMYPGTPYSVLSRATSGFQPSGYLSLTCGECPYD